MVVVKTIYQVSRLTALFCRKALAWLRVAGAALVARCLAVRLRIHASFEFAFSLPFVPDRRLEHPLRRQLPPRRLGR